MSGNEGRNTPRTALSNTGCSYLYRPATRSLLGSNGGFRVTRTGPWSFSGRCCSSFIQSGTKFLFRQRFCLEKKTRTYTFYMERKLSVQEPGKVRDVYSQGNLVNIRLRLSITSNSRACQIVPTRPSQTTFRHELQHNQHQPFPVVVRK